MPISACMLMRMAKTSAASQTLAPVVGKKIKAFLEGLPKRYLRVYPPEEVLHHLDMAHRLAERSRATAICNAAGTGLK